MTLRSSVVLSTMLLFHACDPATGTDTDTDLPPDPLRIDAVSTAPPRPDTTFALSAAVFPYDDELTYTYRWERDGTWLDDLHPSTTTVPASLTAKHQTWQVEVFASLDANDGDPVRSGLVTIENSPPFAESVSLSTLSPAPGQGLSATVHGLFDPDGAGDLDETLFTWWHQPAGTDAWSSLSEESAHLDTTGLAEGDRLYVEAIPIDLEGLTGAPVESEVAELSSPVWEELALGSDHSCGLRRDGTVWCWGRNNNGQLGDATTDDALSPVQVLRADAEPGGEAWSDWIQIGAGSNFTCGLRADRTLWCWGWGSAGRRGDGRVVSTRTTPAQVLRADAAAGSDSVWTDWVTLAVGHDHACGLRANKTLWCWGNGFYGQRGDNTEDSSRTTPTRVLRTGAAAGSGDGWADWIEVFSGGDQTCGYREEIEDLWCWGRNDSGQLGVGSVYTRATVARTVTAGHRWTQLALGRLHACGLSDDGTLWCWGANSDGGLGNNTVTRSTSPSQVRAAASDSETFWSDWVHVAVGDLTSCGIREDGSAWCWGRGTSGRRGDGTTTSSQTLPVLVLEQDADSGTEMGWDDWEILYAGSRHFCGEREGGSLWCWGQGTYGKRGDGTTAEDGTTPSPVTSP